MGELFGAGPEAAYKDRLKTLKKSGVALWDVCAECVRPGSLDSAIARESVTANDFAGLFLRCPKICAAFFNGQAAARLFHAYVLPTPGAKLEFVTLPSTSPANAGISFAEKLGAWRSAFEENSAAAVVLRQFVA